MRLFAPYFVAFFDRRRAAMAFKNAPRLAQKAIITILKNKF